MNKIYKVIWSKVKHQYVVVVVWVAFIYITYKLRAKV